ncbi:MAG TPA: phosphotransferase [Phycisphaerae bacterium]|nr:phosphotransferase [Phycisphaerae bacterium]
MDDRKAYMLNGLLERHFDLGRVVRFRQVQRGLQAECFELLTPGSHELLLYLFPAAFNAGALNAAITLMDKVSVAGFPVPRPLATLSPQNTFVASGPQGTHLVLTMTPQGQPLALREWGIHDLSHLGLRLAWMHRLLADHGLVAAVSPAEMLRHAIREPSPRGERCRQALKMDHLEKFVELLEQTVPVVRGWRHGGLSPESILLDSDRQISAILDWGLTSVGLPQEDMVDVFVLWCIENDGQVKMPEAHSLFQAYLSLNPVDEALWPKAVLAWCAHRTTAALTGTGVLPRGFATILEKPEFLTTAISACLSRI